MLTILLLCSTSYNDMRINAVQYYATDLFEDFSYIVYIMCCIVTFNEVK